MPGDAPATSSNTSHAPPARAAMRCAAAAAGAASLSGISQGAPKSAPNGLVSRSVTAKPAGCPVWRWLLAQAQQRLGLLAQA
jgi:hypothetical protein